MPDSLTTRLPAQVTGQAWRRATESRGSGVRGTGQGSAWRSTTRPGLLRAGQASGVAADPGNCLTSNFLIRLVGETSLQMLITMHDLDRFLVVLSGKKT